MPTPAASPICGAPPVAACNPGTSLPDNLIREVHEETGLTVTVGLPALINEFHDPATGFHQVDIYFHCQIAAWHSRPRMARSRRCGH